MNEPRHEASRGMVAAASVVIGVAVIGLVAGTRPSSYAPLLPEKHQREPRAAGIAARPARSYTELMTRPWGAEMPHGEAVQRVLHVPERRRVASSDAEARQAALADRATHRAYSGAPPTVPHPVGTGNGLECRTCHLQGGMLGQVLVPPMGHADYVQCTQCHVAEVAGVPQSTESFVVASNFEPRRGAPAPDRWAEAPPQMPHRSFMRERCLACHGDFGRHGLQTSHPERRSCTQCHAPAAVVDQMPEVH